MFTLNSVYNCESNLTLLCKFVKVRSPDFNLNPLITLMRARVEVTKVVVEFVSVIHSLPRIVDLVGSEKKSFWKCE